MTLKLLLAAFLILGAFGSRATSAAPVTNGKDSANPNPAPLNQPPPPLAQSRGFPSSPNVSIPDDSYIGVNDGNDGFGADAGMVCDTIDTSGSIDAGAFVTFVGIDLGLTHSSVGDLTVKLKSPDGTILALIERVQGDGENNLGDNGFDNPSGDGSSLDGALLNFADFNFYDAAVMGSTLLVNKSICTDDGLCSYFPNPDQALVAGSSVANFAAFDGEAAAGDWTLCVGDSTFLDTGTFNEWVLLVGYAVPTADLSLTLAAPASAVVGGSSFSYGFFWQNNGPDTAVGATIVDTLPAGISFISAESGCSHSAGTVTCNLGDVTAGSSGLKLISAQATSAGLSTNTAIISSGTADDNGANNSATAITRVLNPDEYIVSAPFAAIPDGSYIGVDDGNDGFGADAGMVCDVIDGADFVPITASVTSIAVNLAVNHTWLGDLTVKLQSPEGTILALLERPQGEWATNNVGDNGTDSPFGDNSNLGGLTGVTQLNFADGNPYDPETVGSSLGDNGNICADDGQCTLQPNPDQALVLGSSAADFSAFVGDRAAGLWTLCVGDSAEADTGSLVAWILYLNYDLIDFFVHLPVAIRE